MSHLINENAIYFKHQALAENPKEAKFDNEHILDLVKRGAVFILNHSAGKDSQSMFIYVSKFVPKSQIKVIHANLPKVDWGDGEQHIKNTIGDVEYISCQSRRNLLEMIEERGMFPSPSFRQCTSDLKRGPIEKAIRNTGVKLIVNCMGMRAQESPNRAKLQTLKFSEKNSKAGREWYDWLPIHDWSIDEVYATIRNAGQEAHWVYKAGMSRYSCVFCIMGNEQDLKTAAALRPELYKKYVELEKSTGQVMMMPTKKHGKRSLEDITGIKAV